MNGICNQASEFARELNRPGPLQHLSLFGKRAAPGQKV